MNDAEWADRLISRFGERHGKDALRLAEFASLAAQIDAPLLRRLRQTLLPTAEPGIEADLWFGALVECHDSRSCVLYDAVALRLREALPAELRVKAAEITKLSHGHWPAAVQLEETLTALAYDAKRDDARIEQALQPVFRVLSDSDERRALEIARWAIHASRRFHRRLLDVAAVQLLLVASALRLRHARLPAAAHGNAVSAAAVSWLVPAPSTTDPIPMGVALYVDRLRFVEPDASPSSIALPVTKPLLASVSWENADGSFERLVDVNVGAEVAGLRGARNITITTLSPEPSTRYRASKKCRRPNHAQP